MKKRILLILAVALLCGSCEKLFMEEDMPSDAVSSFNYLWQKVDQQYAFFDVKGVDWDSIYNVYIGEVGEGIKYHFPSWSSRNSQVPAPS